MKNLLFHRKNPTSGVEDPWEGLVKNVSPDEQYFKLAKFFNCTENNIFACSSYPVFCAFQVPLKKTKDGNHYCTIPQKYINKFVKDNKRYGILLFRKDTFSQMINDCAKQKVLIYYEGNVDYIDE